MSLNILWGRVFRINLKASELIFSTIAKIHLRCVQRDIQLVVLGIPPQPMTKQGNIVCRTFNAFLKQKCLADKIEYLDSFSKMNKEDSFLTDKLHLSQSGHHDLGIILFEGITDAMID